MRIARTIASLLLMAVLVVSGCSSKTASTNETANQTQSNPTAQNINTNVSVNVTPSPPDISPNATDTAAAGADFVNNALASFIPTSGWTPPLSPTGGQKPRALTQQEKDRLLQIANSFRAVVDMKNNPDVVGIYSNFLWVEWIGHPDGEGFLNYDPVEKGTVNISNKSDNWFPAADFIFQSRFSRLSAVGIHVAVNLETGKVVWSGGYVTVLPETVSNTSLNVPQTSNLFIAMNNVGTMSGVVRQLTISDNGSVVYIEQTGMRIILPGSYVTKTTKTGVIKKESIDKLRGMVDAIPFDDSGNFQAGTHTMDTAVLSSLSVNLSGVKHVIYSNFDPLYFDAALIPDVPPSVQTLYHELWNIAQHQTTQVSSEKIY